MTERPELIDSSFARNRLRQRLICRYVVHSRFRQALRDFAASEEDADSFCTRWGLEFDDQAAENAIDAWRESRQEYKAPCIHLVSLFSVGAFVPRMNDVIRIPIFWDPTEKSIEEAAAGYNKLATDRIRAALEEILHAHKGLPDQFTDPPRQRRQSANLHLKWLHARQCYGWDYPKIAEKFSISSADETVRRTCSRIASDLGLKLRT